MRLFQIFVASIAIYFSALTFAAADNKSPQEIARQKNTQAWNALQKFGKPLLAVKLAALANNKICNHELVKGSLLEPAISFPLAALALAAIVNAREDDESKALNNYAFFIAKGLFASAAVLASDPCGRFFQKLNEGWFKDLFTSNFVHEKHGTGFRTLVLFHTLNLFLNDPLVRLVYGTE